MFMLTAADLDLFISILDFLIPLTSRGFAGFLTQLQSLVQTFVLV